MANNVQVEFIICDGDASVVADKIGLNATKWQMEAASVREVLAKLIELSPNPNLLCHSLYKDHGVLRSVWFITINYEPTYGGRNGRHEFDAPLEDGDRITFGTAV